MKTQHICATILLFVHCKCTLAPNTEGCWIGNIHTIPQPICPIFSTRYQIIHCVCNISIFISVDLNHSMVYKSRKLFYAKKAALFMWKIVFGFYFVYEYYLASTNQFRQLVQAKISGSTNGSSRWGAMAWCISLVQCINLVQGCHCLVIILAEKK